jgi:cell division protein FtsZ
MERDGTADDTKAAARLLVAGVGGAGGNAVRGLLRAGLPGVDLLAINTDAQALARTQAPRWLRIGPRLTRGLGAGGDPEIGLRAAEESRDAIRASLAGNDMVFLAAGLGGGTGTGAGPAVAAMARELGALTVAVVSTPFVFEGEQRRLAAERGLAALSEQVDTLIVVPNERLLPLAGTEMRLSEAYALADDVLRQGVRAISDLIARAGHINLDFADVRAVLTDAGSAVLGVGQASGADRVAEALGAALSHPLVDREITGARAALVQISGGPDLTLREVSQVVEELRRLVRPDANVVFGTAEDDACAGALRVTVVASGFAPHIARSAGDGLRVQRAVPAVLEAASARSGMVALPRLAADAPANDDDEPRTGPVSVRPAG